MRNQLLENFRVQLSNQDDSTALQNVFFSMGIGWEYTPHQVVQLPSPHWLLVSGNTMLWGDKLNPNEIEKYTEVNMKIIKVEADEPNERQFRIHHAERIAHAYGYEVQVASPKIGEWMDCPDPTWHADLIYRVTPEAEEFPVTHFTDEELMNIYHNTESPREFANEIIKAHVQQESEAVNTNPVQDFGL